MIAVMPLKTGHTIHPEVLRGLTSQTVPIELLCVSSDPVPRCPREISINLNRHTMQGLVPTDTEYVLLMDSDVVIESSETVETLIDYLATHLDVGCVAVDTKNTGNNDSTHVITALALIRYSDYIKIDYYSALCQCLQIGMRMPVVLHPTLRAYEVERPYAEVAQLIAKVQKEVAEANAEAPSPATR